MAVTLRLFRLGKKHEPKYRIIAVDKRAKRDGKYIDLLGFYDPIQNPHKVEIDSKKLAYWKGKGALISEGLAKLLKNK